MTVRTLDPDDTLLFSASESDHRISVWGSPDRFCLSLPLMVMALPRQADASIGFATVRTFTDGTTPQVVVTADFNGDGKLDMAAANSGSNNVSVLLGNGDGTFQAAVNYNVGATPMGLAVGVFNNDGHPDLVAANNAGANVSVVFDRRHVHAASEGQS